MKTNHIIAILGSLLMLSCATKTSSSSSQASGKKAGFQIRAFQEETLPNGLKLIYIQDSSLPALRLTAFVKMGAWHDPEDLAGLSSMTSYLIQDGTNQMSAPQIAEELAYLGAEYGSSTDHEKTSFSISSLSPNKEKALKIFSEMLLSPSFATKEIERRKSQVIAGLQKLTENPTNYADILLDQTIFGKHAYGTMVSGNLKSVPKINRAEVMRHYFKFFRPNNAWLAISGDFDENFKVLVRKTFGEWANSPVPQEPTSNLTETSLPGIRLISKPGLQQSQIRIGELGINRKDPDFLKLRLASLILGGAFESRLNMKVRDELGLTYSISSKFEALKEGGSFEISTFSRNDKAAEVVKETKAVVKTFVEKGVTSSELEAAKMLMVSQFPASVETPAETAVSLLRLRYYEIPDSYLQDFISNVSAITLKEVNEAIKKHIRPEQLKTVIYADQSQVLESLKALGPVNVETL
jgi:zinc protease